MTTELLNAQDEIDLSGDSAVEVITSTWTITEGEFEETDSPNGTGERINLTFESEDWHYPITMRFFVSYTPSDSTKSTDWVKRQRGQLKNIIKAAGGDPTKAKGAVTEGSDNYIVGKSVKATTKDGGDGFAALGRFKSVE